ncbi:YlqD family protein [Pelotomaculum isophthalicicum JI]|uniref:YlqD family protein n=1 Tax=Pelotomaculum isophthalicicum JI TaxID=947010 RepID=A0A9X4JV19_9FIRM|nr:YlqD family protein [Pelotomaculum isophthalicicum]MDF9407451.1 YlqD family protein [Pelotomaculum isophthalicicum JI]
MESLTLIRPVLVKVKVTDNYKKNAIAELQDAIRRIEIDLQRLDYQEKRLVVELEKKNPQGIPAARQHLDQERQRMAENRHKLIDRLKEVGELSLGAEVLYGKMESPVEIKVGDDWRRVLGVEVVLQDGVITEIR